MKRIAAYLLVLLMALTPCLPAVAQEQMAEPNADADAIAIADAAQGVARLLTIDAKGNYRGASAFAVGVPGMPTDTFVTTYAAVTDENGAVAPEIYLLLEDVTLKVVATTPYKKVNKVDTPQETITGQDQNKKNVTIHRGLTVEGFKPEAQIECELLFPSSDKNFAILKASRPIDQFMPLTLATKERQPRLGDKLTVTGYRDPSADYASEKHTLRNSNFYTVETATYTIKATAAYVNVIGGAITQYDETGVARFLHSAVTDDSSDGGALVMADGRVAGVAVSHNRFGYTPTAVTGATKSDFGGVYIEDVLLELERKDIPVSAPDAPPETQPDPTIAPAVVDPEPDPADDDAPDAADDPAPDPADDDAPMVVADEPSVPTFWERAIAYIRHNLLIAIIGLVVLVLLALIIILLVKGRKDARTEPLVAEDVPSEPRAGGGAAPSEPMRVSETMPVSDVCLRGSNGEMRGKTYSLDDRMRVGRNPKENDIVFSMQAKGVSGNHCLIFQRDGRVYIEDAGSTYGTFINGAHRLGKGQIYELRVGDVIGVGSDRETFIVSSRGGA